MRAVDVGVRKDADLAVAQPLEIRIAVLVMRIDADRERNVVNRIGAEKLVGADFPSIENFAPQRQHGLELLVAAHLGGTASRVAFNNKELVAAHIVGFAVGELAGKHSDARGFLLLILRRLPLARLRQADDVLGELLAVLEVVVEPEFKLRAHEAAHKLKRVAARELFLRLPLKLRIERFGGKYEIRPSEDIFSEHLHALRLQPMRVHKGAHRLKRPSLRPDSCVPPCGVGIRFT